MKLKVASVKYAVGSETKASRDSDGEGEEPRGEGPPRRARHSGAPSDHKGSGEHAHTTGPDSPVAMATSQAQAVHLAAVQSSELENVIEQVGIFFCFVNWEK